MIDIEVDNPFEVQEKILQRQVRILTKEIIRLRLKYGEAITETEMLMGFAHEPGGYKILRSPNWPK